MTSYQISINQLPAFGQATEAGKRTIIKQQIVPFIPKVSWYRLSKARIAKYFELRNLKPINEALEQLRKKELKEPKDIKARDADIAALLKFKNIPLPQILKALEYEVIKSSNKFTFLEDVNIKVAPEIIFRGVLNGKTVIGAIKLHVTQNNLFELQEAQDISSVIYHFLKQKVAKKTDIVTPELCFCLDVFSGRLVPSSQKLIQDLSRIKKSCMELKVLWDKIITIEVNDLPPQDPNLQSLINLSFNKPKNESSTAHWVLNFWPSNFSEASNLLSKQNIPFKKI